MKQNQFSWFPFDNIPTNLMELSKKNIRRENGFNLGQRERRKCRW